MDTPRLDSLTSSERTVLRVLLRARDQKAIARELNLSPETVKTHLRNAREKTGIGTSFALARAFADHDAPPPERGIPRPEGEPWGIDSAIPMPSMRPGRADRNGDAVREERAVFTFDQASIPIPPVRQTEKRNALTAWPRLGTIIALVLLLTIVVLLAFPLSESFQRFANVIAPPQH